MSETDDEVRAAAGRYREHRRVVLEMLHPRESPYTHIEVSTGAAGFVPAACDRDAHTLAAAVLAWEDRMGVIDAAGPAGRGHPLTIEGLLALAGTAPAFAVGDPVRKVGGDYVFEGVVRGVVVKASGAVRFAVEDARGVLMIYSAKNLERPA